MPRLFLLCSILLFVNSWSFGQDLIIRITGDTIHCKIDLVDDNFVHYRSRDSKRRNSELISTREVMQLLYGVEEPSKEALKAPPSEIKNPKFKLHGSFGFSRLLSSEDFQDEFLEEYDSELRWGTALDLGVNFIINEEWSLGFLYGNSTYDNEVEVVLIPINGGPSLSGYLSDDISITYYGANAIYRTVQIESNNAFEVAFGLGYVSYENDAQLISSINQTASGLGIHGSLGYALSLGQGFSIPFRFGFKGFSVSNVDIRFGEDTPAEIRESLLFQLQGDPSLAITRIELSAGLSLSF